MSNTWERAAQVAFVLAVIAMFIAMALFVQPDPPCKGPSHTELRPLVVGRAVMAHTVTVCGK